MRLPNWLKSTLAGLLFPLGFAPFHIPGFSLISLAIFYYMSSKGSVKQAGVIGFAFGFGLFSFGVSWISISIHDYGDMNWLITAFITALFIAYLSLFPALCALIFNRWFDRYAIYKNIFFFASLWTLTEYLRAHLFTGFPWLLLGTTELDTPLINLIPIVGQYGTGFIAAIAAGLLAEIYKHEALKRSLLMAFLVLLLLIPKLLDNHQWVYVNEKPISVGVVQANMSMRDKWDAQLFSQILKHYEVEVNKLLGKDLIVLPESAIPLPPQYVEPYLKKLDKSALKHQSTLLFGILIPAEEKEVFQNAIIASGVSRGQYIKQHLVPFGEYIPQPFTYISNLLGIPPANILAGPTVQALIDINGAKIAGLICYEIAWPALVRAQLPMANVLVAVSDDGWFGHSLASYQQQQMAQLLSAQTGRYQIMANNDGLSSVIDEKGKIVDSLKAYSSGLLMSSVHSATGATPWVLMGDWPILIFCLLFLLPNLARGVILSNLIKNKT